MELATYKLVIASVTRTGLVPLVTSAQMTILAVIVLNIRLVDPAGALLRHSWKLLVSFLYNSRKITFTRKKAALLAVALVAGAAFYYWRYRRAGQRYKLVNRFNMDDEEEGGAGTHTFAEQDNQLVDEEDHAQGGDHEEAHPDEVAPTESSADLPSPAGSVNAEQPEAFSSSSILSIFRSLPFFISLIN